MSTVTTLVKPWSSDGLELLEHFGDARPDHVALLAQGRELGVSGRRVTKAQAELVELLCEPRLIVGGLRLFRTKPRDHAHEQFDLFLEAINRLEIHRTRQGLLCHPFKPLVGELISRKMVTRRGRARTRKMPLVVGGCSASCFSVAPRRDDPSARRA